MSVKEGSNIFTVLKTEGKYWNGEGWNQKEETTSKKEVVDNPSH